MSESPVTKEMRRAGARILEAAILEEMQFHKLGAAEDTAKRIFLAMERTRKDYLSRLPVPPGGSKDAPY